MVSRPQCVHQPREIRLGGAFPKLQGGDGLRSGPGTNHLGSREQAAGQGRARRHQGEPSSPACGASLLVHGAHDTQLLHGVPHLVRRQRIGQGHPLTAGCAPTGQGEQRPSEVGVPDLRGGFGIHAGPVLGCQAPHRHPRPQTSSTSGALDRRSPGLPNRHQAGHAPTTVQTRLPGQP